MVSQVVDEEVLASECAALVTRYCSLEPGQLDQSLVLAQCIQQIVQRGGQRMEDGAAENRTAMWDRLLSCAYLGSHDSDAESRAVWTATWLEALSTSGAGTKLGAVLRTLPLLLEMVKTMYLERSWHRRVQAVQVFREVIDILPGDTLEAEFAKAEVSRRVTDLLRTLLLSIPGQVWSGQAVVLDVISELVAKYKAHVIFSSVMADTSAATVEVLSAGDDLESSLTLEKLTNANLCRHILNDLADAADPRAAAAAASVRTLKWELSFFGWALLLVHESRRGARNNSNLAEAEYRLAAARAVSLLPWPALWATPEGVVTFGRLLPVLCKQSNIPPYVRVVLPDASNSGAAVRDGTDSAGQGQGQAKRGNKRTLGSAALFGVRYSMKDSGNPSRSRPDQNTATREISEAPTVTLHDNEEGQEEEGMVMAAEEAQGEPEGAVDSHEHEQRVQVQVVGSNSTVESMDVENSTCDKLNSAADCDVAVTTVEDVILSETAVQQEEFVHKHPPAYHVFYIDSLLRCWPRDECTFPVLESQLADCAQHILVWAEAAMRTEVWSLRKAAAQLVGAAASSRPLSPAQCASALLVIELAISEQKFVKVRVEALKCLALVLQSVNRAHINSSEELKTRVRELIRNASTDSQPTILEAVAKVQNVWLR